MARTAALLTARLRQRPYREEDLDRLWQVWTDPEVRRYLWDDQVIARDTAAATMHESIACTREHGFGHWAVTWRDDDAPIGFCGLRWRQEAPADVELVYGLDPALWGRGLITEAAHAWLRYGFESLERSHIWALTDAPNARSEAVMRRLGMRFERRLALNGLDSVRYVIGRSEFTPGDGPYAVIA
jgi:ribosomal-protein-alanine N-acetyltransferase